MLGRREDELRSAAALAGQLQNRVLGASLLKGNGDEVHRFIEGGDTPAKIEGARDRATGDGVLRDLKRTLRDLDERPATMFEVLNGGWIYNRNFLDRPLMTVDDRVMQDATASRHALEGFCEELLQPSFQIQQSLRIALVLSSIRARLESTNGETERR